MSTIIPFLQDGAFDPNEIQAMSMAYDEICNTLNLPITAQAAREVIAERIIELASARGERSHIRLREGVLQELGLTDAANGNPRWSGL